MASLPQVLRENAIQYRITRREPSKEQREMCDYLAAQHAAENPEIILNAGLDEHDALFSMVIVGAEGKGRACVVSHDGSTHWTD